MCYCLYIYINIYVLYVCIICSLVHQEPFDEHNNTPPEEFLQYDPALESVFIKEGRNQHIDLNCVVHFLRGLLMCPQKMKSPTLGDSVKFLNLTMIYLFIRKHWQKL